MMLGIEPELVVRSFGLTSLLLPALPDLVMQRVPLLSMLRDHRFGLLDVLANPLHLLRHVVIHLLQ